MQPYCSKFSQACIFTARACPKFFAMMAVSSEVVLPESQIFTQRKTNFKNKKRTILTMIIFYLSYVFISHFLVQCKSFMEPKHGYFHEYNILYAKPTLRRLFTAALCQEKINETDTNFISF